MLRGRRRRRGSNGREEGPRRGAGAPCVRSPPRRRRAAVRPRPCRQRPRSARDPAQPTEGLGRGRPRGGGRGRGQGGGEARGQFGLREGPAFPLGSEKFRLGQLGSRPGLQPRAGPTGCVEEEAEPGGRGGRLGVGTWPPGHIPWRWNLCLNHPYAPETQSGAERARAAPEDPRGDSGCGQSRISRAPVRARAGEEAGSHLHPPQPLWKPWARSQKGYQAELAQPRGMRRAGVNSHNCEHSRTHFKQTLGSVVQWQRRWIAVRILVFINVMCKQRRNFPDDRIEKNKLITVKSFLFEETEANRYQMTCLGPPI